MEGRGWDGWVRERIGMQWRRPVLYDLMHDSLSSGSISLFFGFEVAGGDETLTPSLV